MRLELFVSLQVTVHTYTIETGVVEELVKSTSNLIIVITLLDVRVNLQADLVGVVF